WGGGGGGGGAVGGGALLGGPPRRARRPAGRGARGRLRRRGAAVQASGGPFRHVEPCPPRFGCLRGESAAAYRPSLYEIRDSAADAPWDVQNSRPPSRAASASAAIRPWYL